MIEHAEMDSAALLAKIQTAFPRAALGGLDFLVPLNDCEVQFYCMSTSALEFRVKATASSSSGANARSVTAVELLVRSTGVLWAGLEKALKVGGRRGRPNLARCVIEDASYRGALLTCDMTSPMRSTGARVSFGLAAIFTLVGIGLIIWQFSTPHSGSDREANVLGISLSLFVSAIALPVPIFINWREWKKELSWKYVRSGP
ncbi:hypothetical protein ACFO3J_20580 [Streptomyces polygonati]|uniref:Uncharacterized protein n=1 Tax=Streptomyces polygonati TaxID=1617087 RepID=A0ABV8HSA2_9ACTN